ncbi:MAG TPA: methylmalonyl-CoA mutase family protein, partial [Xanthomonadales bacterium]|nr:methylmalonyl-CoA mutase family protein [Xanthomonadales bacterium]
MSRDESLPDSSQLDAWRAAAARSAPGGDVEALTWHTLEGLGVKPLYTAADTAGLPYADTLPGFPPYLRGPQATMYATRPWTIRQYAG